MTIYIAGPMSGLPEHNYPAFYAAEKKLVNLGHHVINPARLDDESGETARTWDWYLRRDLQAMLGSADVVVLLPGWESSRGAMLERYVALTLGMIVLTLQEVLGQPKGEKR